MSLLIWVTGRTNFPGPTLLGAPFVMLAVAGFYFVQRWGLFRLFGAIISHSAKHESWRSLVLRSDELDQVLGKIYSRLGSVIACCVVTMISFVTGSVEVWMGLHALGVPASFEKALILECVFPSGSTARKSHKRLGL